MPITRDSSGRFTSPSSLADWELELLGRLGETNEAPQVDPIMPRCMEPRCMERGCTARSCMRVESDFDVYGNDCYGFNREGYNYAGYDWNGYDREGYDRRGFNRNRIHRDTGNAYDREGYSRSGYDRDGYDRQGYNSDGFNRSGYDAAGYDSGGEDRRGRTRCDNGECEGDDCSCSDDYDNGYSRLESYSYTPRLAFHGDGKPWYGMEIEVTTDQVSNAVDLVNEYAPDTKYGDKLIYCKSDSSVDGMEMVTHPMSYAWAMEHFPWELLPALRDRADSTVVASDNGIHVHVGRDGFDNSAHMYRWFKLWYRNPSDIQRIARRRASHWGAFNPTHRTGQAEHVKRDKPGYDRSKDTTRERYSAINTINEATLEVRVFASSLRPTRVKAALQLVAASVEYTRQLTADDITHRRGWDWRAFMSWVRHDGSYPDLVTEDRRRRY